MKRLLDLLNSRRRKAAVLGVLLVAVLAGVIAGMSAPTRKTDVPEAGVWLTIPDSAELQMVESFVIPLNTPDVYTFARVTVKMVYRGDGAAGEMTAKRAQLRGMIYDLLEKEVRGIDSETLRAVVSAVIRDRVNASLTVANVDTVMITEITTV